MSDTTLILSADDETAKALVSTIRGAVNGAARYYEYVVAHEVTRANVKDHARALAVLAYPNEKPVQAADGVRTVFGNAVQAAGKGLRTALGKGDPKATDWLKLVAQAASNAFVKGEHTPADIMAAVESALQADIVPEVDAA